MIIRVNFAVFKNSFFYSTSKKTFLGNESHLQDKLEETCNSYTHDLESDKGKIKALL